MVNRWNNLYQTKPLNLERCDRSSAIPSVNAWRSIHGAIKLLLRNEEKLNVITFVASREVDI